MSRARKRFIAGAECPACHTMDTLMLTIQGEQETVSCVQCGHEFTEREQPSVAPAESPAKPVDKNIIGIFKPD
jgi:uncharacterized protein